MRTLEKVSGFAGKHMAIIALLVAIIALIFPQPIHAAIPTKHADVADVDGLAGKQKNQCRGYERGHDGGACGHANRQGAICNIALAPI